MPSVTPSSVAVFVMSNSAVVVTVAFRSAPPLTVKAPLTAIVPFTVRLPPESVKFSMEFTLAIVWVPLECVIVRVPGWSMTTSSALPGRAPLLQFAAVFQSPEPPIHVTVASRHRDSKASMRDALRRRRVWTRGDAVRKNRLRRVRRIIGGFRQCGCAAAQESIGRCTVNSKCPPNRISAVEIGRIAELVYSDEIPAYLEATRFVVFEEAKSPQ